MKQEKKNNRKGKEQKSTSQESLEQLIENRKTVADAYRKILESLESKIKKNK